MLKLLIRFVCLSLVRLFYRRVRLVGRERLPVNGPAIVVANHPNGLLDPLIVGLGLARPVHFLAKSTLFHSWLGRQTMEAFLAVPVFRAKEADTSQNEKTFALCREIMARGEWLALFPEGTSHSETTLLPLKTGAARIALQSGDGVTIVPVGLTYEDKEIFRSGVTVSVGEPFTLEHYRQTYVADPIGAAKVVTDEITRRMKDVVLEADDRTLWRGFRFVARWIAAKTPAHESDADVDAMARTLAQAYREGLSERPEEIAALVHDAKKLDRMLDAIGIPDPFAIDLPVSAGKIFWYAVWAVAVAPLALVGAALAWVPYRLVGVLTPKLTKGETDLASTVKALLGLVLIGGTYVVEAIVTGVVFSWPYALVALFVLPFTGYVALRYFEWLARRRRLAGTWLLRISHKELVAKIETERAALCERVSAALRQ